MGMVKFDNDHSRNGNYSDRIASNVRRIQKLEDKIMKIEKQKFKKDK